MNKLLRVAFALVIVAMLSASVLQIFFANYMGSNSEYGISLGWQREIGFWNLAIIPMLVGINIKYDWFFLRVILVSLIIGGIGFGTNHLLGFLEDSTKLTSLVGALENYILVLCWIVGWRLENKKIKNLSPV